MSTPGRGVLARMLALVAAMLLLALPAPAVCAAEPLLVPIDARIGTEARGRERGEQAARADIAAGLLKLYEASEPGTVREPARQRVREGLLRKKGIRLELGPGCTEPGEQRGFHAAYNERMAAEVKRRFGPDFWTQLDMAAPR